MHAKSNDDKKLETKKLTKNKKNNEFRTNLAEVIGEAVIVVYDNDWFDGIFSGNGGVRVRFSSDGRQRSFWDEPTSPLEMERK